MKKSLIASAIAVSVAAPAMAQVSISGFFNASYDYNEISKAHSSRVGRLNESRVTDNASRIIFSVNEDLGGGMRALGQFDLRVAMDAMQPLHTGDAIGASNLNGPVVNAINGGNNHVGLHTPMGTFRFGRQDIQYTENALTMPVGLATIASHAGLFHQVTSTRSLTGATRTPNLAWWVSPRWNGVQATLGYSTNPSASSSQPVQGENDLAKIGPGARTGSGTWIKLDATLGKLALVYSQIDMKPDYTGTAQAAGTGGAAATGNLAWTGIAQTNEKGKVLTGKYDLGGGWNVGLGFTRNEGTVVLTGVSTKTQAAQLGIGYATGAHVIGYGLTRLGDQKLNTTGKQTDTGVNAQTLAYGYNLSKRTQLHASYVVMDNDPNQNSNLFYNAATVMGNASARNGEKLSAYSLGIRHSF